MAHRFERLIAGVRARPIRSALVVVAVLLVLTVWTCATRKSDAEKTGMLQRRYVATQQAFSISTGFAGEIAPGDSIAIIAPFDGVLKRLDFTYGEHVEAGQVLAEFDTADVRRAKNDAEGAYLRSAKTAADMRDWDSGPEMSRARRNLSNAEYELAQTERRLTETKSLLDRGLVPRVEYEGLEQQVRAQKMALEAAREDLVLTAERGQGASRRVAMLDYENATERLSNVSTDIAGARVVAPDAGIIVMPPSADQSKAEAIAVGTRISKGQPLGVIARAGGLGVRFQLDEGDVNAVKIGQPVVVTGAGFPGAVLKGRIHSVAGQANKEGSSGGKAAFVATALLDPIPPEQARLVRIGMTANLNVVAYTNPSVVVLPLKAIQGPPSKPFVVIQDRRRKTEREVPVRLGRASPDQVEVLSGVKAGDRVVWNEPDTRRASRRR